MKRLIIGLLVLAAIGYAGIWLQLKGAYGLTLFCASPALLGGVTGWIVQPRSGWRATGVGALSAGLGTLSLLFLGMEGAICVYMALPLTTFLGSLGALMVYQLQKTRPEAIAMLLLIPPVSLTLDARAVTPIFEVHSSIEISATPEQVWKNVVSFPEMEQPKEWYFRTGLAYPTQSRLVGSGVGAARYCDFSTGPAVERVIVWDEPRRLKFVVTETPAPMREWSPYEREIVPKHLYGYMLSRQGEFRLTALPHGRTLLEGTSWYSHGLWPAGYWRWWSDAIARRIHMRVLANIRELSESKALARADIIQ